MLSTYAIQQWQLIGAVIQAYMLDFSKPYNSMYLAATF